MAVLERAKKVKLPGQDWQLIKMVQNQVNILKELKLLPKDPVLPKRKRGRPRKSQPIV